MIQFFGDGLWWALLYFLRRHRFTNNLETRIRDVIVVLRGHFPSTADANDEEMQKKEQLLDRQGLELGLSLWQISNFAVTTSRSVLGCKNHLRVKVWLFCNANRAWRKQAKFGSEFYSSIFVVSKYVANKLWGKHLHCCMQFYMRLKFL